MTKTAPAVLRWLFLFSLLYSSVLYAQSASPVLITPDPNRAAEQVQTRRLTLEDDRKTLDQLAQELKTLHDGQTNFLQGLRIDTFSPTLREQAQVDSEAAKLRLQALAVDTQTAEQRLQDLENAIRDLESQEQLLLNPAKAAEVGPEHDRLLDLTTTTLGHYHTERDLLKQHLDNLKRERQLSDQKQQLLEERRAQLEEIYKQWDTQNRREAQDNLEQQLQRDKQERGALLTDLRKRLENPALSDVQKRLLQTRIDILDSRNKLDRTDLQLSSADNELSSLDDLKSTQQSGNINTLQDGLKKLEDLLSNLNKGREVFDKEVELLRQQRQVLSQRDSLSDAEVKASNDIIKQLDSLLTEASKRQERLSALMQQGTTLQQSIQERLEAIINSSLFSRARFPNSIEGFNRLFNGLISAPQVLYYQVQLSVSALFKSVINAEPLYWGGLAFLELGLLIVFIYTRRWLRYVRTRMEDCVDASFTHNMLLLSINLGYKNLKGLCLALAMLIVLWLFTVPQPGLSILITLILLWVGLKMPINLFWLLLASPRLPDQQRQLPLYRQLRWSLLLGGSLAAIAALARFSQLPVGVIEVFDRTFLVSLLVLLWPVIRGRTFLLKLMEKRFDGQFGFIALKFITLIIPLALLIIALLGIVGYLNLAWSVASHLSLLLVIFITWVLVRGLLDDGVVWLKNYAVSHSDNALLWTQEIISPLHRIINTLIFVGMWLSLLLAYGLEGNSTALIAIRRFINAPLFSLAGAEISLWRIAVSIISILVVIWFAQWCRAVTYRWVFSRVLDLGVRHSLSVFTQYFVVLIGLLITLNIIGLDLTTLTVFAGAVGVGIGFGMQNIANNFISGVLLLIERPLRSGDTVQIGTNVGEIKRIGIRSLTLRTADNMDVIIPNSAVITGAFTNWTHNDNVVRTVLMIGISYDDDPQEAKRILERCVNAHKDILRDPAPGVFLWEFGPSSLDFRVQFHTDIARTGSLGIRSQLLLEIFKSFKEAGISIPYPQQDVYVKQWPGVKNPTPSDVEPTPTVPHIKVDLDKHDL